MDQRIASLPHAPLPLDQDSYYEVLVPDGSSATGYTSCKIKPSAIFGVKTYKALLSQSSTNAPTIVSNGTGANTPLVNTLGGTPTLGYVSPGVFSLTLTGAFPQTKTFTNKGSFVSGTDFAKGYEVYRVDDNNLYIQTYDVPTSTQENDILYYTPIEIEVYQ